MQETISIFKGVIFLNLDQFRDVDLVIDKANDNFIQRQFVSQGDYKGRTLTVKVTDNGVIGEIPGIVLNLRWQNQTSGLTDLSAFTLIDKKNSVFRIEYPQHMMTPGKVVANIQVIQNGQVTHLKTFEMTVQALAGEMTGIVSQAEYGALVAVLAEANKFRTDIETLEMEKADKIEVDRLQDTKANQSFVDSQFAAIVSGTPKGTYATLADLTAAYPAGTSGVFLVLSNGHWYYWNETSKTWLDGGIYQAQTDNPLTRSATIVSPAYWNVNTLTNQIEFGSRFLVITEGYNQYDLSAYRGKTFLLTASGHLIYSTTSNELKIVSSIAQITEADLYLGWFYSSDTDKRYNFNGLYTVDGAINAPVRSVKSGQRTKIGEFAVLSSSLPININTADKTIEFPDATISLSYGTGSVNLRDIYGGKTFDISFGGATAGWLYADPYTRTLVTSDKGVTENYYLLGAIWWTRNKFDLAFNYTVNGALPSEALKGSYGFGKTMVCLGDSLTEAHHGGNVNIRSYSEFLPTYTGLKCLNYGVGGSQVQITEGKTDSFVERITSAPNADFLMLFGGMNDFRGSSPLGDLAPIGTALEDFDTHTYVGALEYCINYWLTNNPRSTIFICTIPLQNRGATHSFSPNGLGLYQKDYNQKVKELSERYSLPLIDLWQLGMTPFNPEQNSFWFLDAMHYRDGGYERMAQYMAGEIKRHIY